jgi:hypothetical protein
MLKTMIHNRAVFLPKGEFNMTMAAIRNPAEGPTQLKNVSIGIVASPQFAAAK